jgi:hypothetical protein
MFICFLLFHFADDEMCPHRVYYHGEVNVYDSFPHVMKSRIFVVKAIRSLICCKSKQVAFVPESQYSVNQEPSMSYKSILIMMKMVTPKYFMIHMDYH